MGDITNKSLSPLRVEVTILLTLWLCALGPSLGASRIKGNMASNK